jgi:3-phenylpropionate/trans-cinnamate dioxygenase ferredoxin reductase subunit
MGKDVVVVEAASRLCGRAVAPTMSDWLLALHRRHDVDVKLSTAVKGLEGHGAACTVHLDDRSLKAELVVVGIGSTANDDLAKQAGLDVSAGIMVGPDLMTSAQDVYAIGDCARFPAYPWSETIRLESVQNAVDQAKYLAAKFTGATGDYRKVPWFWTEQFGQKVQMAGLSHHGRRCEVVPADVAGRFNVNHYLDERLVAVDSVNDTKSHVAARKELTPLYCGQ